MHAPTDLIIGAWRVSEPLEMLLINFGLVSFRSTANRSNAARCQGDYCRTDGLVRQSGQQRNTHVPREAAGDFCPGYWANLLVPRPLHTDTLRGPSE